MSSFLHRAIAAALSLLFLTLAASAGATTKLNTGAFDPPRAAPDFTLRGSNGKDIQLRDYRGKVVALSFGYTSCPDVCPATLFLLAQARERLGAARDDFQIVYVTVDPERDDAERLRKYVAAFDPAFLGATGAPDRLAEVHKAYGIQVAREKVAGSQTAYLIHHSSFVYLIDRDGKIRAMVPFGSSVDDVVHDVKALLGK